MRNKFFALVFGVTLLMPCTLRAEEIEIQLMEVVGMNVLPGDNPLDDSNPVGGVYNANGTLIY